MTTNENYKAPGCYIAHSVEQALSMCEGEEVFILGGEEIYRQFQPYTHKLYITKINHYFKGDRFFPEFDFSLWKELSVEKGIEDERNHYEHYFHVYEKIN